jgi:sec-independent protein translocase protein TatA
MFGEMMLLGAVALILFGPEKAQEIGRAVGELVAALRNASRGITDEITRKIEERPAPKTADPIAAPRLGAPMPAAPVEGVMAEPEILAEPEIVAVIAEETPTPAWRGGATHPVTPEELAAAEQRRAARAQVKAPVSSLPEPETSVVHPV